MQKKYTVRRTEPEPEMGREGIRKRKGTSEKARRAHIPLKTDGVGPASTDARIAQAFGCGTQTVKNIRHCFVELSPLTLLESGEPPPLSIVVQFESMEPPGRADTKRHSRAALPRRRPCRRPHEGKIFCQGPGPNFCSSVNGCVEHGFQQTLEREKPQRLPAKKLLDGEWRGEHRRDAAGATSEG